MSLSSKDSFVNLVVQRMIFLDTNPILFKVIRHHVGVVFDGEGIPNFLRKPEIVTGVNSDGFIVVTMLLLSLRGEVPNAVVGLIQLAAVNLQTIVEKLDHCIRAVRGSPADPVIVARFALQSRVRWGNQSRNCPKRPAVRKLRIANGYRDSQISSLTCFFHDSEVFGNPSKSIVSP
jgi:hypothetical protein